jgi:hypothetical protein
MLFRRLYMLHWLETCQLPCPLLMCWLCSPGLNPLLLMALSPPAPASGAPAGGEQQVPPPVDAGCAAHVDPAQGVGTPAGGTGSAAGSTAAAARAGRQPRTRTSSSSSRRRRWLSHHALRPARSWGLCVAMPWHFGSPGGTLPRCVVCGGWGGSRGPAVAGASPASQYK